MKKHLYLTGALAAMAILATGCTADDPDNALSLDQTITVDEYGNVTTPGQGGSGEESKDPLSKARLQRINVGSLDYNVVYDSSGRPVSMTFSGWYGDMPDVYYEFSYQLPGEGPSKIRWYYTTNNSNYDMVRYETVLDGLEFEDGLMKKAIFSKSTYVNDNLDGVTASGQAVFTYNGSHQLTNINVDGQDYAQVWDADGDLVEIDSPHFGKSTLKYGKVVNRWRQWDPTMPLMGVFQTFGWFGTAPVHFPTEITTSSNIFLKALNIDNSRAGESYTLSLNYYISWEERISQVRAYWLLDQYTDAELSYISMK